MVINLIYTKISYTLFLFFMSNKRMNNFLGPEEMNSCTDFKFPQEEWQRPEIRKFYNF